MYRKIFSLLKWLQLIFIAGVIEEVFAENYCQEEQPMQASDEPSEDSGQAEQDCELSEPSGEAVTHYIPPYFFPNLRFNIGDGIGYRHGYTTLETLVTGNTDLFLVPFLDLRAHRFNGGKYAGNLGVGIRTLVPSHRKIYGFNLFYDYRRAHSDYNQLGVGLERFDGIWGLYMNGYFPVGKKTEHLHYFRSSRTVKERTLNSITSIDLNIDTVLYCDKEVGMWVGAGVYGLKTPYNRNAIGGQWRLDFLACTMLLSWKQSYDSLFGLRGQFEVSLKLPYGCHSNLLKENEVQEVDNHFIMQKIMTKPIVRHEIIPVVKHTITHR